MQKNPKCLLVKNKNVKLMLQTVFSIRHEHATQHVVSEYDIKHCSE